MTKKNKDLVNKDGKRFEKQEKEIRVDVYPKTILVKPIIERETSAGLILPESTGKKENQTPIGEVVAIGSHVKKQYKELGFDLQKGDYVYVDAGYMRFGNVDDVAVLILMADGIIGKLPKDQLETVEKEEDGESNITS